MGCLKLSLLYGTAFLDEALSFVVDADILAIEKRFRHGRLYRWPLTVASEFWLDVFGGVLI